MKRIIYLVAGLLFLAACGSNNNDSTASGVEFDPTRDSLRQALADQDSLIVLLTEIQQGLDEIKGVAQVINTEQFSGETADRRKALRDDMQLIRQSIEERAKRLAELEARLKKSNNNNAHLQKAIESLRAQIADQNAVIAQLENDLADANVRIEELTKDVNRYQVIAAVNDAERAAAEDRNEQLTNELNACYYAIGSSKELKQHNIIEKGFLRKTKVMPEDFEREFFTLADKRTLTSIPLHSKKAKLLTAQPQSSYTFTTDPSGMKVLEITNPTQFWEASNFVVIQID